MSMGELQVCARLPICISRMWPYSYPNGPAVAGGGAARMPMCIAVCGALWTCAYPNARGAQDGRHVIIDDYREAYWWLRDNTPADARVMAWWDYGYQVCAWGSVM